MVAVTGFAPISRVDGYLPIADHGLIGDGRGAALVGRDGTVSWMCVPSFDSPPLLCALLDRHRGGSFQLTADGLRESRQYYHDDTGVLVTELRTDTGVVAVTDAFLLRDDADLAGGGRVAAGALLRQVDVRHGEVTMTMRLDPRGQVHVARSGATLRLRCAHVPGVALTLRATVPVAGLHASLRLAAGQQVRVCLEWTGTATAVPVPTPDSTIAAWRRWARRIRYEGPQARMVRRSAITLKLLDHAENGAIVAAPTSSLPEVIGGPRNWDYRYTWVRDAAFSVYALRRIGLTAEANRFLGWVLHATERAGRPLILYDLHGLRPPPERADPGLEGYRRSAPVRWGNNAANQVQHDVYGEILDCAHQWVSGGGRLDRRLWRHLAVLAHTARSVWRQPDHGIWEIRSARRPFSYSVALCQVALDRAARLAALLGLPGDRSGWAAESERIRQTLLERAWDPQAGALTEHLGPAAPGSRGLDASLLALPLRRVVPADHPRMRATTAAISGRLDAGGGLLYRYLPGDSPDGLCGHEGAFVLCSFWLVDNLARQGRIDDAGRLYESLCARANPLGLFPEQIDPSTGAFLGNYPQAFSHVGVISSAISLNRVASTGAIPWSHRPVPGAPADDSRDGTLSIVDLRGHS